jgi:D-serine deaminase-like pyridoxal phosphate-dependent protein
MLDALRDDPIDWRYRGFPAAEPPATPATIRERRWNLLAGDLPTPVVVLRETALAHNLSLMAAWCAAHDVRLAPHAKTTMSPELIARQLGAGAWAMTVATVAQARVLRAFGVQRLILANEVVEPPALGWLAAELAADADLECYVLVDSAEAAEALARGLRRLERSLPVLLELGETGGRAGARTEEAALAAAAAVAAAPGLELAGLELFEGLAGHDREAATLRRVDAVVDQLVALLPRLPLGDRSEVTLSAGGSAYFDRVVARLQPARSDPRVRIVLRSGCYLTHDVGIYARSSALGDVAAPDERLRPALEAWAAVLSRPEPDLAILNLGRRDVSHDAGLPVPFAVASGGELRGTGPMTIERLNDQHAYLRLPADDPLAVGDLVGSGISHPCTTFDKWRLIPIVDDDYTVIDAVHTFF